MTPETRRQLENQIRACYSSWAHTYFANYYGENSTYPPMHAEVAKRILLTNGVRRLLDAGCGPGSFLQYISDTDIEWHGFDLVPEMTAEANKVVESLGKLDSEVWTGSVLNDESFESPSGVQFDGAVLIGVLPHVPEGSDGLVLRRLLDSVGPGGTLIAEARNALFGLFSLNRPSYELFVQTLIDLDSIKAWADTAAIAVLSEVELDLKSRFAMELPPLRVGAENELGYDEVLSRTHVPFELEEVARQSGWVDVKIHYAHFHALPPMYESQFPDFYRKIGILREDPKDWRGLVMASTFLISGKKPVET